MNLKQVIRLLFPETKPPRIMSTGEFLIHMLRHFIFGGVVLGFSIGFGIAGYMYFAGLNAVDAFHMSCLLLTGMGPVAEMKTDTAKIFSSIFALYSGVAFVTVSGVYMAPILHRLLQVFHVDQEEK